MRPKNINPVKEVVAAIFIITILVVSILILSDREQWALELMTESDWTFTMVASVAMFIVILVVGMIILMQPHDD